jgi:hypothetical protein
MITGGRGKEKKKKKRAASSESGSEEKQDKRAKKKVKIFYNRKIRENEERGEGGTGYILVPVPILRHRYKVGRRLKTGN